MQSGGDKSYGITIWCLLCKEWSCKKCKLSHSTELTACLHYRPLKGVVSVRQIDLEGAFTLHRMRSPHALSWILVHFNDPNALSCILVLCHDWSALPQSKLRLSCILVHFHELSCLYKSKLALLPDLTYVLSLYSRTLCLVTGTSCVTSSFVVYWTLKG